jgi:hypothetical protein
MQEATARERAAEQGHATGSVSRGAGDFKPLRY